MAEWTVEGKTYDSEPPWWFRRAYFVALAVSSPLLLAAPLRSWPLAALGLVLSLLYLVPVIIWERRHQVR